MSIECLPFDTGRCSLHDLRERRVKTATSEKRVAANRRNAQRSTGPRTPRGKRRSSQNALRHGLCQSFGSRLPGECGATYHRFVAELREQLQPRSVMQLTLFPQICDLVWRLERLPEAQTKLFHEELDKASDPGETLSASDVLARRFSDDPTRNGFLLMGRYEAQLRNQFLRLLRQYEREQKLRATTPYDADEKPVPDEGSEPAWSEEKAEAQRLWFRTPAGQAESARLAQIRDEAIARRDAGQAEQVARAARAAEARAALDEKQTQSKPTETPADDAETGKYRDSSSRATTERTHRADAVSTASAREDDDRDDRDGGPNSPQRELGVACGIAPRAFAPTGSPRNSTLPGGAIPACSTAPPSSSSDSFSPAPTLAHSPLIARSGQV